MCPSFVSVPAFATGPLQGGGRASVHPLWPGFLFVPGTQEAFGKQLFN